MDQVSDCQFLMRLADFVLNNKYKSFVTWSLQRQKLIIKNRQAFLGRIMYPLFRTSNFEQFQTIMRQQGFYCLQVPRQQKMPNLIFRCSNPFRFNQLLRLRDITCQIDKQCKLTNNHIQSLMGILDHPLPQIVDKIFTLKSFNRRINDLSFNAILIAGEVFPCDISSNYSESDDGVIPLQTKTMQVIALTIDF